MWGLDFAGEMEVSVGLCCSRDAIEWDRVGLGLGVYVWGVNSVRWINYYFCCNHF